MQCKTFNLLKEINLVYYREQSSVDKGSKKVFKRVLKRNGFTSVNNVKLLEWPKLCFRKYICQHCWHEISSIFFL